MKISPLKSTLLLSLLLLAALTLTPRPHAQPAPAQDNDPDFLAAIAHAFPHPSDIYLIGSDLKQPTLTAAHLIRVTTVANATFYEATLPDNSTILINPTQIAYIQMPHK